MSAPASITRSLMLWLTVATILFWIVAATVATLVMRGELDEVFDSALTETAQRLMPILVDDLFQGGTLQEPRPIEQAGTVDDHEEYLLYQLRDTEGKVLLRSHDAPAEPFAAALRPGFEDIAPYRVLTTVAVSGTLFLQIAEPAEHRAEAIGETALALILPLGVLAPASVLAIWLIVGRALLPITTLRRAIGRRGGGRLDPLDAGPQPKELAGIVGSVDRLLERLRAALESERAFTANSAHELRTPIAGALAQTQRLLAELPVGTTRERARRIESSLSGLARLVEKLLQLARAEAGIGNAAEERDLVPIIRMVVEDFRRQPDRDTELVLSIAQGASLVRTVDIDAFAIVLRNLIDNAMTHGDQLSAVTVDLGADGAVTVANHGPTVAASELAELTQRFRRARTDGEGSGLGLAICDTLVRRMGGTLILQSPAHGQPDGFAATVRL